jgi:hypothetical protein
VQVVEVAEAIVMVTVSQVLVVAVLVELVDEMLMVLMEQFLPFKILEAAERAAHLLT